ncbi:MAG: TIGR02391 family protein [Daejeonella sp.]|uniref:TIGR02391 family protein n=1 Tax=Daejeonella sp. TaxID=2805397 RepID=UPI002736529D|nr:TIGR02391 family protein [Daejeonella sp.]MDP3468483.1 TIGR02391 family protein [Daejeonella sp.]
MSDLKDLIEERLWNFIKRNYNSENYTNAVLDSIQFVGDVIREKSGLDGDGNTLVGAAFGGENPRIKLNKLKTETEKNIQKGIESILRGIYSAYRNPRSHSKTDDSERDAFEIIIFLNHLLKVIDKSTGRFTVDLFLKRVFDEDFVQSKKYSDLLIKDVPSNKYFEITVEIFRAKESGKIHNLKFIWEGLMEKLSENDKKEITSLASEELRFTDSLSKVVRCIALFKDTWEELDEDARLRSENKLIKCIGRGEKSVTGNLNQDAVYATWLPQILKKSLLKSEIADAIYDAIESKDLDKQRLVLDTFGHYFDELEPLAFLESFDHLFEVELKNGNGVIYDFITRRGSKERKIKFKELMDSFVDPSEDNLPF